MFLFNLTLKFAPLATILIFGLAVVAPNAALAKKVKGKGTVEILAASGKDAAAKKKASSPAELGPGGLRAPCKQKYEEFKDWDNHFKAFALGVTKDMMACAFAEGDSETQVENILYKRLEEIELFVKSI